AERGWVFTSGHRRGPGRRAPGLESVRATGTPYSRAPGLARRDHRASARGGRVGRVLHRDCLVAPNSLVEARGLSLRLHVETPGKDLSQALVDSQGFRSPAIQP